MSYDAYLYIDTGGPQPACVAEIGNMTGNVSPMWTKALGFHLLALDGQRGGVCADHLERAIAKIANPDHRHEYEAMSPSNGWGSVEAAEGFLQRMLDACRAHPMATLRLSC